jgi:hypothetical protein
MKREVDVDDEDVMSRAVLRHTVFSLVAPRCLTRLGFSSAG